VAVNTFMIVQLIGERYPGLTEDDQLLHDAFFERMSPKQFKSLLEISERRTLRDGAILTTEREPCSSLYFVESGVTSLTVNGEQVADIGRGGFINDVAFQQGPASGAYGTICAIGEVRVIMWDMERLREELARCEPLANSLSYVLVGIQIEQLLQRYKQREEKERELQRQQTGSRLRLRASGEMFRDGFEMARGRGRKLLEYTTTSRVPSSEESRTRGGDERPNARDAGEKPDNAPA
jgi:CRP-like cAMP-binding protein